MATPPLPNETVELVEHEVAFQGYFRVGRYFFRHGLYQGGQSGTLRREVFERGHAGRRAALRSRCVTRSC